MMCKIAGTDRGRMWYPAATFGGKDTGVGGGGGMEETVPDVVVSRRWGQSARGGGERRSLGSRKRRKKWRRRDMSQTEKRDWCVEVESDTQST